jgi:hypothetical protein
VWGGFICQGLSTFFTTFHIMECLKQTVKSKKVQNFFSLPMRKILLLILILAGFALAKIPCLNFFSFGARIFPSNNDVRFYVETSCWVPFVGIDTGIEIGTHNIELYGEAEAGIGFFGYSHGLYYRFPYGANNYYGWRGRFWAGIAYYASFDLDYTEDMRGFGVFASLPLVLRLYDDYDIEEFLNCFSCK